MIFFLTSMDVSNFEKAILKDMKKFPCFCWVTENKFWKMRNGVATQAADKCFHSFFIEVLSNFCKCFYFVELERNTEMMFFFLLAGRERKTL